MDLHEEINNWLDTDTSITGATIEAFLHSIGYVIQPRECLRDECEQVAPCVWRARDGLWSAKPLTQEQILGFVTRC